MSKAHILAAVLTILGGAVIVLSTQPSAASEEVPTRTIRIVVDGTYTPSRIDVTEGEIIHLDFFRKDYSPCTSEVVFPTLGIRRSLPTNEHVIIELPRLEAGEVEFRCGMNMAKGKIVVHPKGHTH